MLAQPMEKERRRARGLIPLCLLLLPLVGASYTAVLGTFFMPTRPAVKRSCGKRIHRVPRAPAPDQAWEGHRWEAPAGTQPRLIRARFDSELP